MTMDVDTSAGRQNLVVVEDMRDAKLDIRAKRAHVLLNWAPVCVLAVLFLFFTLFAPGFASLGNIRAIAFASSVPLIFATGLTFVVLQGGIDLSGEGVMATSSLLVSLLILNNVTGNDFGFLAIVVSLVAGLLIGATNGIIHVTLRLPTLMVTLGTWYVGLGVATLLFPSRQPILMDPLMVGIVRSEWMGFTPSDCLALGSLSLGFFIQKYTTFGRGCYAIGNDERLASIAGIKVDRFKILAFSIAGFFAALAGLVASARMGIGSVEVGSNTLFSTLTAVVIGGTLLNGGKGGVLNSAIGVLILQVLRSGLLVSGVDPYLQKLVEGASIVVVLAVSTWSFRSALRVVK